MIKLSLSSRLNLFLMKFRRCVYCGITGFQVWHVYKMDNVMMCGGCHTVACYVKEEYGSEKSKKIVRERVKMIKKLPKVEVSEVLCIARFGRKMIRGGEINA